jgi:hypothetical protein
VPATSSSLVARIARRLGHYDQPTPPELGLVVHLATVPDPRDRRGVCHRLASLLSVVVCAVLAGAKSLTAIGEWVADAPASMAPVPAPPAVEPPTPRQAWPAVAVDGKTLRGSGGPTNPAVHLLAAMRHSTTAVLGQVAVDGKSNEITAFAPLLAPLNLTRTVVTADVLSRYRDNTSATISVPAREPRRAFTRASSAGSLHSRRVSV